MVCLFELVGSARLVTKSNVRVDIVELEDAPSTLLLTLHYARTHGIRVTFEDRSNLTPRERFGLAPLD